MTKDSGVYVPKLPGCEPWNPVAAQQRKSGRLSYRNGVPYVLDPLSSDGAPAEDLSQSQLLKLGGIVDGTIAPKVTEVTHWDVDADPYATGASAGADGEDAAAGMLGSTAPQWIAYDRRVLRFFGFFKEPVVESAKENFRIRKVTIFYYLEDGTMHIGEPREDNSGIPQGVFLKRHVAELDSGEVLGIQHLNVGRDLELYGRVFHIVACDGFTREFLGVQGFEVPDDEGIPEDPHRLQQTIKAAQSTHKPTRKNKSLEELRKFFDYDRKVLRFFCVWDDRRNLYGDNIPYVLHYYLSDDTVEVNEVHARNTGRDSFPKLLARGKLPKNHQDTGPFMSRQIRHYDWTDLAIGRTVNVWGRALFMYDCDEFTRSWFRKHGAPEEALEAVPIDVERKLAVPKQAVAPDWYGIGTERDQMQSVNSLIPKPPKFGWEQFMEHGSSALRFAARLVPEHGCRLLPADDIREFVISYFLADDTIQIYEPPIRNSGIIGGKFLERTAIKKPHAVNQDYRARDLYVGAHLVTLSRCFELYDADVATFKFMEDNAHLFPQADIARVLDACRAALSGPEARQQVEQRVRMATDEETGTVPVPDVAAALAEAGCELSPHELVTLARHLGDPRGKDPVPAVKLLAELGMQDAE